MHGGALLALLAASVGALRLPLHTRFAASRGGALIATSPVAAAAEAAELKARLLDSVRAFKAAQEAQWEAEEDSAASTAAQVDERVSSPLKAEGFGNVELGYDDTLGALRNQTVELIEQLAALNPTAAPLAGWREREGPLCELHGTWRLLFTTGADATFRKTNATGKPTTFQQIDARKGYFVNCVDFRGGAAETKLRGFRVVVKGVREGDDEVLLKFRRVKLLRKSRVPFLRTIVVPLPPSGLLRAVARWASRGKAQLSSRGAGFKLLYLDDDLRMHKTFDGQYFVQQRCRYWYR